MARLIRGTRVGLMVLLVALAMLFAALPASADSSKGSSSPRNITWENSAGITWE